MPKKVKVKVKKSVEKGSLHPRNLHIGRYDLQELCASSPGLKPFVAPNQYGDESVDFSNPEAVKALNGALLKHFYGIDGWDIPEGYLCPPIPGRVDYIHNMADLLAESNNGVIPTGNKIKVLDIGVGANCVYPLIGNSVYGWQFVGTDIDSKAIDSAEKVVSLNKQLKDAIEIRFQANRAEIFKGVVNEGEVFDLVVCNPPFHATRQEAQDSSAQKWEKLGVTEDKKGLNFGGTNTELWYAGGEAAFIGKMINQSLLLARQCMWFSTLVSRRETLPVIYKALEKVGAIDVKTINMSQGQKISRVVTWTYLNEAERTEWMQKRLDAV
ncbi:23S rRNA (adenine(1618)-N(6))-methyltransferase RlmF [Mucilaginibacter polytrichastri]|nr:23S rRNA (adenine(1618)-N(6))-methyltransferase RlmF [Mucilaginibacter polytrichastri]SFS97181.1 23S rRNA m(6)A-1618 methyltransferase [Mucilaginibacter polytrichastri]